MALFPCARERRLGAGLRYSLKSEYLSPLNDQAIPQARTQMPGHLPRPSLSNVTMGSITCTPYCELYVALIMTTTTRAPGGVYQCNRLCRGLHPARGGPAHSRGQFRQRLHSAPRGARRGQPRAILTKPTAHTQAPVRVQIHHDLVHQGTTGAHCTGDEAPTMGHVRHDSFSDWPPGSGQAISGWLL